MNGIQATMPNPSLTQKLAQNLTLKSDWLLGMLFQEYVLLCEIMVTVWLKGCEQANLVTKA